MDPIHPILPQPPNLPPVTEAPRIGRITREEQRRRDQAGREDRDRSDRRAQDGRAQDGRAQDENGDGVTPPEAGPHIDVTA